MQDVEDRRDLSLLVVPDVGRLMETNNECEPYCLFDRDGLSVEPAALFFAELQASGRSRSTIRSYGNVCCGGGGFWQRSRWVGTARHRRRLAISHGGCSWRAGRSACIGGIEGGGRCLRAVV
ncbi:hypothetical protein [Dactylosporangium sp. NPDC049140]|uniref:hypothetical protein n=1 Tax=Dactylosporangium sp. NPDC049140 TaxID=3155647 RepID=UPI0033C3A956